jgi:hypothetical protein
MPNEMDYSPNLVLGDDISCDYDNVNKLCISFTSNGFFFKALMPWGNPDSENIYTEWDLSKPDYLNTIENYLSEFGPNSKYIDRNPINIRCFYMQMLCDSLMADYWTDHRELPINLEELLDSKWNPVVQRLDNLAIIDQGSSGWFYYGACPDKNIMYMEYVLEDTSPVVFQKIYLIDDPDQQNPGIIGRCLCLEEGINRTETVTLIDSSLSRWGF